MSGYMCTICDNANGEVVQLTTSLETGKTLAMCRTCMPAAYIGALAAELEVTASGLYDVIKRYVDREIKKQEQAAAAQAEQDTAEHDEPDDDEPDDDDYVGIDDDGGHIYADDADPDAELTHGSLPVEGM